jgi:hypothetical protein
MERPQKCTNMNVCPGYEDLVILSWPSRTPVASEMHGDDMYENDTPVYLLFGHIYKDHCVC